MWTSNSLEMVPRSLKASTVNQKICSHLVIYSYYNQFLRSRDQNLTKVLLQLLISQSSRNSLSNIEKLKLEFLEFQLVFLIFEPKQDVMSQSAKKRKKWAKERRFIASTLHQRAPHKSAKEVSSWILRNGAATLTSARGKTVQPSPLFCIISLSSRVALRSGFTP